MRALRLSLLLLFLMSGFHLSSAQSSADDKQALDAFKTYIKQHLASYKQNRRERITELGGGWVKEYFEPDLDSAAVDVQKTNSLMSPYTGKLDFQLIRHFTNFHKTREEAAADSNFVKTMTFAHHHTYAYQDDRWVPKTRKHESPGLGSELFDCDQVTSSGERDLFGCLEEYDSPAASTGG